MPRSDWRTFLTLAAALVLPLVLFVALQGAFAMQAQRRSIEQDAAGRAREINAQVDGQLWSDRSALEVLSSSQFLIARDWPGAYDRISRVVAARPRWKNVILTDTATGREIFETRSALGKNRPARPSVRAYLAGGGAKAQIDGVGDMTSPGCPCVTLHVPVLEKGVLTYVLSVEMGTEDFQAILKSHAPETGVSAIVDTKGRFLARTLNYRGKAGKPATIYVRRAIATARDGSYRGVTYEGLKSVTTFDTSELSGWSTHIATSAARLSAPLRGAWLLNGVSTLAVLILAAALAWFTLRRLAEQSRELKRQEQSQRLAAIGQLASGVAHDFNNLLMVITGSLQLIGKRTDDPALVRPLKNAQDAADRGAALTRQLLDFARAGPVDLESVDLAALLPSLSGLLGQTLGPAITLVIDIDPAAATVTSNAAQLELALINLAVNARDAMPDGGTLTIAARPARQPGGIDLTVRDTGQGMPPAVAERAMEPFFTTKGVGKGTGLGLAQVFGIVSRSGGSVSIDSTEGVGTTITMTLPAA
ncbi:signal transduction histidine kinase [Caulobacter ginsengisoli]|uniref:histidine kinase n=1 Tax=Caulobacter ginsengisoli TaxID=400775 RepID=A0ABU0IKJ2_9CAUL|nr:ATP-binding protein [Caulobacter ginsengisoli]MDQ0462531.1 signal transduction histidine kinase [Caulobacter ginsengisoli]